MHSQPTMRPFIMGIYVGEVETQCILALQAYRELRKVQRKYVARKRVSQRVKHEQEYQMLIFIHAFLSHSAGINRLFRPQSPPGEGKQALRQFTKDRGTLLTEALFPGRLRPPRLILQVRNDIEHFDERLDSWVLKQGDGFAGLYTDLVFIAPGTTTIWGWAGDSNTPRRYDIRKAQLYLYGDEFDLDQTSKEIHRILRRTRMWDHFKFPGRRYPRRRSRPKDED